MITSKWIGPNKKWVKSQTDSWELDLSPPLRQKLVTVNLVKSGKQFVILQVSHEKMDEHEKRGKVERFVRLLLPDIRYLMLKKGEIVKATSSGPPFNRDVKPTGTNIWVDKKIKAVVVRNGTNQIYLNMSQFANLTQFIREFPALAAPAKAHVPVEEEPRSRLCRPE